MFLFLPVSFEQIARTNVVKYLAVLQVQVRSFCDYMFHFHFLCAALVWNVCLLRLKERICGEEKRVEFLVEKEKLKK